MQVTWAGGRKILTDKLFVVITTSFLDKHVSIDNNLLGGASEAGKPDVASREMVDGLYVLAHIASVAAQDICDAVFATGHSRPVYEEMNAPVCVFITAGPFTKLCALGPVRNPVL